MLEAHCLLSEPPGKSKNTGVVASPFSRGTSQTQESNWSPALQVDSSPAELLGKPFLKILY